MSTEFTSNISGYIRKAEAGTTAKGNKFYNVQISTNGPYFNRQTQKTSFVPFTIYLTVFGTFSQGLENLLTQEGAPIVVFGARDITVEVATDDAGNPKRYTTGDRNGDFIYNYRGTADARSLQFPKVKSEDASTTTTTTEESHQPVPSSNDEPGFLK